MGPCNRPRELVYAVQVAVRRAHASVHGLHMSTLNLFEGGCRSDSGGCEVGYVGIGSGAGVFEPCGSNAALTKNQQSVASSFERTASWSIGVRTSDPYMRGVDVDGDAAA